MGKEQSEKVKSKREDVRAEIDVRRKRGKELREKVRGRGNR
jgi:hypothetical protein